MSLSVRGRHPSFGHSLAWRPFFADFRKLLEGAYLPFQLVMNKIPSDPALRRHYEPPVVEVLVGRTRTISSPP